MPSLLRQIENIQDVVDWDLCTGCGACFSHCERGAVTLINIGSVGIRPRFDSETCQNCTRCLAVCPGYKLELPVPAETKRAPDLGAEEFGETLEIWEGHATDPEIRFRASSGGIISALALYCLERENMQFILHSTASPDEPWVNRTVVSSSRDEILARAGSRYAPASPCDGIRQIEESEGTCVFVGKPCDVAAVSLLRRERKQLDERLGLVLTFFCAGTPSSEGSTNLVRSLAIDPASVASVRYRGEGWPGEFRVFSETGAAQASLSYQESWRQLTSYRPLRCNLCPDGLGRFADIACGDAWHKFSGTDRDTGRSLVLVRSARGREILRRAREAGYVRLVPAGADAVFAAQGSLLARRRELFGRIVALRMLRIPAPRFAHFSLFRSWIKLPALRKIQTVTGTLGRAWTRGWRARRPLRVPSSGCRPA
ncbi:MAG: Coenzyme F420 hydrogenase/dehydrogenase, beta subunit C-terminal domain [Acidobacteriaceae bacterium]|nr:Coenzyme F420 hydrogenase/dehydrogenase, beta subunit C-terminal domain [Acidobacteriaceae bacterium]